MENENKKPDFEIISCEILQDRPGHETTNKVAYIIFMVNGVKYGKYIQIANNEPE